MFYKKLYALFLSLVLLLSLIPVQSSAKSAFQATAKPGCKEITLAWTPMEGAINYQPNLYLPDGSYYPLTDFPQASFTFTHTGLEEGKEYCYTILSYDKNAQVVAKTNQVCAKPKCEPEKPENCDIVLKYTVAKNTYFVNDVPYEMETPPVIRESRMYLVISFVTKHIPGTTITWDGAKQQITIKTPEGKTIKLWIGNPKAEVDGVMVDIDPTNPGKGAPFIELGRTKVAMRFVANHLNAKVDWFGATNTVVLTVQDIVNCGCSWVEGCITNWTEAPNDQVQLFFNPNCDETTRPTAYLIDKKLKSKTDQLDIVEYLGKWTGPGKIRRGQMKICVNKLNQVHHWDPMPIPDECTWICGCVRGFEVKDQYIKIWWDKDCNSPDDTQVLTLINATPDSSDHHFPSFQAYFESCNSEWCCIELCYDNSAPPQVIAWKATPEKMPNCCEPEVKWLCGCFKKAEMKMFEYKDPSQTYMIYFDQDCNGNDSPPINIQNIVNIPCEGGSYSTMYQYVSVFPNQNYWCGWVGLQNNVPVAWKATPESYPNCCSTTQLPKKICGCIVRMGLDPDTNGNYYVNVATDCKTDQQAYDVVLYFPATLLDLNKSKNVFTNFYTDLGGPPNKLCFEAEYDPVTKIVTTWWAYPEKTPPDCCRPSANKTGRIFGQVSGNCNPTTIKIEGTGNTSFSGTYTTNATTGYYETSPDNMLRCILPCPGTYRVTPVPIPGVTFSPPYYDIDMKECCEDGKSFEASFKCESTKPTTICGCIISYALKPIPTGKGTAAFVTFVPNCESETPQNLQQFVLDNSLRAGNSADYTMNAADECYRPPSGMPPGNYFWTMRDYTDKWDDGTSQDPVTGKKRWCVTLTIDPSQVLHPDFSQIVSWEMHPEKECKGGKCCDDEAICGCILDYTKQHPTYTNYRNIVYQPNCDEPPINLFMDPYLIADNACNYNISQDTNCWDANDRPWTIDTYADNNPYGTNNRPTTWDDNRRWCVKVWLDPNNPNKIIKWEMYPQEEIISGESKCKCKTCIEEVCQGCIISLVEISTHRWKALFDKDCDPSTNDQIIRYITSQQNYEYLKAILQSCQTTPQKTSNSLQTNNSEIQEEDCPCKIKQLPNPATNLPESSYLPLSSVVSQWFSKVLANVRRLFIKKSVMKENQSFSFHSSTFNQTGTKTWTTDNDFIEGTSMGLNHGPDVWGNNSHSGQGTPHDQLQMTFPGSTYPFIWVPNHNDSTISLVATSTTTFQGIPLVAGIEYGRYKTSLISGNPSRTTVDLDGNCWVANRNCDTVVKIINRFVNPIVDISNPPNGIQTSTGASHLAWGQDDAVVWEVDTGTTQGILRPGNQAQSTYSNTQGLRSASIDRNNRLWVGGYNSEKVYVVSYNNNEVPYLERTIDVGLSPYGSVIDRCGKVYVSTLGSKITRIDPENDYDISTVTVTKSIYGIALDNENPNVIYTASANVCAWDTSNWPTSMGQPIATATVVNASGLTVSNEGIWVAGLSSIFLFSKEIEDVGGTLTLPLIEAENYPSQISGKGVAVDSEGHCWVVGMGSDKIYEYKCSASPASIELIGSDHSVGPSDTAKGHYAYSDMTGLMANSIAAQHGQWSAIKDSGCEDTVWTISWNDETPEHTSIEYYAQHSPNGNTWSNEVQIMNSGSQVPGSGRYLKITVKMKSNPPCTTQIEDFPSPILYDITVSWSSDCGNNCCIYACEMPDPSSPSDMIIYSIKPHIGQDPCCGGNRGGRIKGTIRGNCNPGLTINIYLPSTGQLVWSGTTDSDGNYDTGADCVLICGETYRVEPIPRLDGCNTLTIQPTNHIVTIKNCCPSSGNNPGYETANFICDCKPYKGRIWGKVTGDCQPPTTIKIEGTGSTSYSGTFTTDIYTGRYQTSGSTRDCNLPCPGTYRVTPVPVPGVTFSPPYRDIDMKECCNLSVSYEANFECKSTSTDKFGRIYGKVTGDCNPVTIKINGTGNTQYSGTFTTNSAGVFETSDQSMTNCIIPCPGTYRVTPNPIPGFTFSPPFVDIDMKKCCPDTTYRADFKCVKDSVKAKILALFGDDCKECIAGITVKITDTSTGNLVMSGSPSWVAGNWNKWIYDTDCELPCPGKYTVTPVSSSGCVFTPTSYDIEFSQEKGNCCDKFIHEARSFNCKPSGPKSGRIKAKLPNSCIKGTSFEITDMSVGSINLYGINDDGIKSGIFDTGCNLVCGKTYKVEPVNPNFTFSPTYHTVTIKNCCPDGFEMVEFECKPKQKTARIEGIVSGTCNPDAKVAIYDSAGNVVWSGNTNANGYFETSAPKKPCILKCPGTYKVVVIKDGCTVSPASQTVAFSDRECCEDGQFKKVEFKCECASNGRIRINFRGNCSTPDVTLVRIYTYPEGDLVLVGNSPINNQSTFDTFCIPQLKCGKTYKVVPSNPNLTFTPTERIVTMTKCCTIGNPAPPDQLMEVIEFECKANSSQLCCDWLFRTLPEARIGKVYICPGETSTISFYEVFNNCPKGSNAINFSISYPTDGKIVSITPSSFTLQPQTRQILTIQIKMISPCKPEEVVNYPFTINTKECGKKEVNVAAYCKDCWCKSQSMIIRVTKIDLRGGILEGRPLDSKTSIQFFFSTNEKKWGSIKVDQCIEICYEERKDTKGNIIKWAFDYRVVACPQSVPPVKDSEKLLYLSNDTEAFKLKSS